MFNITFHSAFSRKFKIFSVISSLLFLSIPASYAQQKNQSEPFAKPPAGTFPFDPNTYELEARAIEMTFLGQRSNKKNEGYDSFTGPMVLIPATVEQVKSNLNSSLASTQFRNIQWEKAVDMPLPLYKTPHSLRSFSEFSWISMLWQNRPDIRQALLDAKAKNLNTAQQQGLITNRQNQSIHELLGETENLFTLAKRALDPSVYPNELNAWEMTINKSNEKHRGLLVDVSDITNQRPLTLVVFASKTTEKSAGYFRFKPCPGSPCLFGLPQFKQDITTVTELAPELWQALDSLRVNLSGLTIPDAKKLFFGKHYNINLIGEAPKEKPKAMELTLPFVATKGLDNEVLFFDLYTLKEDFFPRRMLSLADGTILFYAGDNKKTYQVRVNANNQLSIEPPTLLTQTIFNKNDQLVLDANGGIWAYRSAGGYVEYWQNPQTAPVKIELDSRLKGNKPPIITTLANSKIAVSTPNGEFMATYNSSGQLEKQHVFPLENYKEIGVTELAPGKDFEGHAIIDDGLIWTQEKGIDPNTGKMASDITFNKNIPLSKTIRMSLGSQAGNWVLIENGELVLHDKTTLEPLFILSGDYNEVARSAHGKLLASSFNKNIGIIDIAKRQQIAKFFVGAGFNLRDINFSWKGDKLFAYFLGSNGERQLMIWDIPANLRDASSGSSFPNQMWSGY